MNDEFDALPEVPVQEGGDDQGQAPDGDAKAEKPAPSVTEADLDALRSKLQKQASDAQKRAEQAEAQARFLANSLSTVQQTIKEYDPETADAVAAKVALAAQTAELNEYRYRAQVAEFKEQMADKADSIEPGLSASAEYREALSESLATGDNTPLLELLSDKRAEKRWAARQPQAAVQPQESEVEVKKQPQSAGAVPAAPAGVPVNVPQQKKDALKAQRQAAMDEARQRGTLRTQFPLIRDEFNKKAREAGIDPSEIEPG